MKARRRVDPKMQERIKNEVKEEFTRQSNDMAQRVFKLFCVALHQTFGFGKYRLSRLLQAVNELSNEREQDEIFWTHVD